MNDADSREPYVPPAKPVLIATADAASNADFPHPGADDGLVDYASAP